MIRPLAFIPTALLIVTGCGDDGNLEPSAESNFVFNDGVCSGGDDRAFIRETSDQNYLYPGQLPDLAIADFETPVDYLSALIADIDLDPENNESMARDRYSFVISEQRFDEFSTGDFVSLGMRWEIERSEVDGQQSRSLRLTDVQGVTERENPAPAGEAGLNRGDRIVSINGETVDSILDRSGCSLNTEGCQRGAIFDAFGPREEGSAVEFTVIGADGSRFEATVAHRLVEQTEVPVVKVFKRNEGRRVGYFVYRGFTRSSPDDLRRTTIELEEQGVTDLIVDLRYNGGGSFRVTQYFANLLYGMVGDGAVFTRLVHNERNSERNLDYLFGEPNCPDFSDCQGESVSLSGLESLTFIATESTASASELLINGLRVYLPVRVVGSRSFGKPVGFLNVRHSECDQVYAPVSFKTVNADGVGDYFDGFPVDCPAEDDTTRVFGDENEASLAAALALVDGEACPTSDAQARALKSTTRRAAPRSYAELLEELRWQ